MAVFNAVGDQPDHADRGIRAARGLLRASDALAARNPGWPRFRAGIATGPAAVGHVGTADQRSFAAIGDTTNLAARLQTEARPGEALVAAPPRRPAPREPGRAPRPAPLRGRTESVEVFALTGRAP